MKATCFPTSLRQINQTPYNQNFDDLNPNVMPTITTLTAQLLDDRQRIDLYLELTDLPTMLPNVTLTLPDPPSATSPVDGLPPPSPYPDLMLSVLNPTQREVASTVIVSCNEAKVGLTLHLREIAEVGTHTVRVSLYQQDTRLQTITTTFEGRST